MQDSGEVRSMVNIHKPVMLVLLEIKMTEHQSLTDVHKFYSQFMFSTNVSPYG